MRSSILLRVLGQLRDVDAQPFGRFQSKLLKRFKQQVREFVMGT